MLKEPRKIQLHITAIKGSKQPQNEYQSNKKKRGKELGY